LYFCRPLSRPEYVLGKASVLGILLSEITWVPGLVLFAVQATLAGPRWAWDNLWIAGSLILSSLLWITVLSLLAMALSAWVKWRIVAGALLLAMLFFGWGFAGAINAVMRTGNGHFLNLGYLMMTICSSLLQTDAEPVIPALQAWIAVLVYCAICLWLLMRKVRAYEVVR
jgi:ABC-2 type transport system permease protein